jgi:hypothetical protein
MLKHSHRLEDLDMKVLQAVEYMVQQATGNGLSYQADSAGVAAFNIISSRIEMGYSDDYTALNNLAVFGDAVMHPDSANYDVVALVAGLGDPASPMDFLLESTEEDREMALTLVTAASRIKEPFVEINGDYYANTRTIRVASPALADFILSRPDDVERIARVVNERETDDVDIIRDVLDHEQQSLREGVL